MCIKCGFQNYPTYSDVKYVSEDAIFDEVPPYSVDDHFVRYDSNSELYESLMQHLVYTCKVCGYVWREDCRDV